MCWHHLIVAAICLSPRTDAQLVQRSWDSVAKPADVGQPVVLERVIFRGDTLQFHYRAQGAALISATTFKLNTAATPKEIEFTPYQGANADRAYHGLYEFAEGQLRICYRGPGSTRPKDFSDQRDQKSNETTTYLLLKPSPTKSVADWIEVLKGRDRDARGEAFDALQKFGPKALPALPVLIDQLAAPDKSSRTGAALAIGAIGPKAIAAIPKLATALQDSDSYVRLFAAHALGHIGPGAKSAVPALLKQLRDEEGMVRSAVAGALGDIGQESATAVPALVAALRNEKEPCRFFGSLAFYGTPDVKRTIAKSLAQLGKDAVPALTDLLKHPSEEIRWCALYALGEVRTEAKSAAGAIAGLLRNDPSDRVASLAVYSVIEVDPEPERAIPLLVEALKSKSSSVRFAAADLVGKYGPKAWAASPLLVDLYKANDIHIGGSLWVIGESLKRIDPDSARTLGIK
jgi:uncharacterized protein (TIGR03067 family)